SMTIFVRSNLDQLNKLIKLLGMLGSAHAGERAAAGLKATELLRSLDMSWEDVILPQQKMLIGPKEPKDRTGIGTKLALLRDNIDQLSKWERKFVRSLSRFHRLSPKQIAVVDRLADGLERRAA
ncbi:MAG: hypothetical protein ACRD3W_29055, partial [Terriglobales bacterium]